MQRAGATTTSRRCTIGSTTIAVCNSNMDTVLGAYTAVAHEGGYSSTVPEFVR